MFLLASLLLSSAHGLSPFSTVSYTGSFRSPSMLSATLTNTTFLPTGGGSGDCQATDTGCSAMLTFFQCFVDGINEGGTFDKCSTIMQCCQFIQSFASESITCTPDGPSGVEMACGGNMCETVCAEKSLRVDCNFLQNCFHKQSGDVTECGCKIKGWVIACACILAFFALYSCLCKAKKRKGGNSQPLLS